MRRATENFELLLVGTGFASFTRAIFSNNLKLIIFKPEGKRPSFI